MALDKKFENLFLKVSSQAAISSNNFVGKKNKPCPIGKLIPGPKKSTNVEKILFIEKSL